MSDLLTLTKYGLYCPVAKVFIDPKEPVRQAIITHAHADHSRPGHNHYLCTVGSMPVMRYRLGRRANIEAKPYGEKLNINGVDFSFHPAGHIPGSAQVRVAYKGEVWVVSGDYKLEQDGISEPFESVTCHTFITEATFANPMYDWPDSGQSYSEINAWWRENQQAGKVSIIAAYALGKAQRILHNVDASIGPIFCHPSVENLNHIMRSHGIDLPDTTRISRKRQDHANALIVATPPAVRGAWGTRFSQRSVALASGWVQQEKMFKKFKTDIGFPVSDHADWKGIMKAVKDSGASRILATHGTTDTLVAHLKKKGLDAAELKTPTIS